MLPETDSPLWRRTLAIIFRSNRCRLSLIWLTLPVSLNSRRLQPCVPIGAIRNQLAGVLLSVMDRHTMEHHLALAEGHVSKGMDILVAQRALMSRLEHEGRDTREASALLIQFEDTLAQAIADRDWLRTELWGDDASPLEESVSPH